MTENSPKQSNVKMALAFAADGMPVHIDDAVNGKACNSTCIDCGCPVIAKNRGKVASHYSHDPNFYNPELCNWKPETELHLMAKMVIAKHKVLDVPIGTIEPSYKCINFDTVTLEKRVGNRIPDIIAYSNGENILIEIAVTHPCGPEKIAEMKRSFANCLEIDLSEFHFEQQALSLNTVSEYLKEAPIKWLSVSPVGDIGQETYNHNQSLQRQLAIELKTASDELSRIKAEVEPLRSKHRTALKKLNALEDTIDKQFKDYDKQKQKMLQNESELARLRTLDKELARFQINNENLAIKIQNVYEKERELGLRERSIREQQIELERRERSEHEYQRRMAEKNASIMRSEIEAEIKSKKKDYQQELESLDTARKNFDALVEKKAAEKIIKIEQKLHAEANKQKEIIIEQAKAAQKRAFELISPLPGHLKKQFDKAKSFAKPDYDIIKEVEDIAMRLSKK